MAVNFSDESGPEYIGTLASDNPWEFIHKARSGQPGVAEMPSAIDLGWSDEELASVLTYAQSLPTSSPVSEGGILYDKWWTAIGADVPEGDQPLWATQTTNTRSGADTWRCKECHGWDYKGADGVYGAGSHATGFAGILAAATKPAEELAAALTGATNQDHDFSSYLSEDQIGMLVAFMQEGMIDKTPYINADKSVNGDEAHGKVLYTAACQRCHGADGKTLNFASGDAKEYMGTVAADNPWEFLNKATVGQPGEHMPSGLNLGWSIQDAVDVMKYAQTLPIE